MHPVTTPLAAVRSTAPVMAMPSAAPVESTDADLDGGVDSPWLTVVWDDPVNLMSYVTYVFQRVFGYSREKAHDLMLKVHNDGRAVVSSGSRDKVENDVRKLQEAGLWATMQREA
ncbi:MULTISPECIES: ATP-dependent Clp protease adapter ClpS [Dietzia]|jgi:ATP-dependent Clp protease adaptor protein ClpS|nr:ATP-dependent Clp protease adapter ClpS [Dietzia sp. SLG510A3-30A2]MBB0994759.1 ATP-dependent Clp protease adapter ClpS [Dietzia sp. SLG510A3-40A3]MBB0997677.1 ATP-dependent Clp protease adapter ClpS [Dietzia maris]MBB1009749.1 ATP-dependent Clp protease adapter ClpS [Dietzia sp. SLG510A3-3B2-2]MBB1011138.1 ATP-dependent Clp protease adapter ClpS [Dietzia kunjamensis]MBB1016261.1 ATP-dependent Clp protease adapter ClpS [Dietzia kunjamensis subsp. schimae]MBB1017941.1 ATP-dependent Clp prot